MGQTNPTDARDLLMAVDVEGYNALMRQIRFSYGEPWASWQTAPKGADGDFPSFPDTRVRALKIGESRRVLNNAVLTLSRVLTGDPEPNYPQLDTPTAEVRKQVWLSRYQAHEFGTELQDGFLDGDNLGGGFVVCGPRTNPATGYTYADMMHVPAQRFLYDESVRSPGKAGWFAAIHEVPPYKALAMFAKVPGAAELIKQHTHSTTIGTMNKARKYVRITEWWDMGLGLNSPTCMYWIGPWSGKPIKKEEHEYERLPFAYMEYVSMPGMPRPIGKVLLQQATVMMINEMEGRFRNHVRRGRTFDILDEKQLDPSDVKRLNAGDDNVKVRMTNSDPKGKPPYIRVPAAEIAATDFHYLQWLDNQYNSDSSSTEMDRATAPPNGTATRDQLMDLRSQQGQTLTRVRALQYVTRCVRLWNMVAAKVDRDPVYVDFKGHKLLINDPSNPSMRMDEVMREYSSIEIGQQSLEHGDVLAKQAQRAMQIDELLPWIQAGLVNGGWAAEERVKAIGERDVTAALAPPPAPAPMPGAVGPDGQPIPGGAPGAPPAPGTAPALPPGMNPLPMVKANQAGP